MTQTTINQSIGKKTLAERIKEYIKTENISVDNSNILSDEDVEEPIILQADKQKNTKKSRKTKEPMSMERYHAEFTPDKLRIIDTWTIDKYYEYYSKVLPAIKNFMNVDDGYKPIAIENNIPYWLETNQITRRCSSRCKLSDKSHKRYLLPVGTNKLSMFWCELDPLLQGSSIFNRYKVFGNILWTIDDIINKPDMMKTIRSLYYHSTIRYSENKDKYWTKQWDEISALNGIVDIDITNKHSTDIYQKEDKWGHSRYDMSFEMLSKIADALTNVGIKFKIRSSGNGWYFEFEKITIKEHNILEYENLYCNKDETKTIKHRDGTTDTYIAKKEDVFWNRIVDRIQYVKDYIIRPIIEEKYSKYFELDSGKPYPNKLYKAPYSLHQRLDYTAKPTNLDEINCNSAQEFKELCSPDIVLNNTIDYWKEWK